MNKLKLLVFVLFLPLKSQAFFYEQEDKNLHVATGLALTFTITSTLMLTCPKLSSREAAIIAVGTTLLLGVAKEMHDDKLDWEDMGANALGSGLGSIPFIVIEF